MDKVKTERYPSLAMIRRLVAFKLRRRTRRELYDPRGPARPSYAGYLDWG